MNRLAMGVALLALAVASCDTTDRARGLADGSRGSDLATVQPSALERQDDSLSALPVPISIAAVEVEHYESLAAMTGQADLVVEGTVTSLDVGRLVGDRAEPGSLAAIVYMQVAPEVLIAGEQARGDATRVTVEVPAADEQTADAYDVLEGATGIFFLRDLGREAQSLEVSDAESYSGRYRLVSSQGLLVDVDGLVVPAFWAEDGFPSTLEGEDYEAVVAEVVELG